MRRIDAGERIAITVHGRAVAELVPPGAAGKAAVQVVSTSLSLRA
jgi:antitoxin (DNA-binding transcriptional repressor) of toxin-antitoxin stability system